ncbi:MAG: DUF302 domain-containing protein [Gammaproteobacteria bacterium]|nr:DUF302 domain-containing protein [Gammaproteobacteria bacterium]MDH5593459.1 DUF302 domain-containing protein [Gammaproteobacteria bacterium]
MGHKYNNFNSYWPQRSVFWFEKGIHVVRIITLILLIGLVLMSWTIGLSGVARSDGSTNAFVTPEEHRVVFTTIGNFDDVKTYISDEIKNRGLVINNISYIGDMLERTGKDTGVGKQLYLKAEALEFCSAAVSRKMMEADPHNIVMCPYIIFIYVLPDESEKVYISYRRPVIKHASQDVAESLKAVEDLLQGIIKDAL